MGSIPRGLVVLLGVGGEDTEEQVRWLARKVARLRIFPDERHHMNRSVQDVQGAALVVSQFTLYGDCRKGNRPSFTAAGPPEHAEPLYERFCTLLSTEHGVPVERGRFGAMMDVSLVNAGPVTLLLETP